MNILKQVIKELTRYSLVCNHMRWISTICISLFCLVSNIAYAEDYDAMRARIHTQMQSPDRHEFDAPKDEFRKAFEVFRFLGLNTGMVCMDVAAYAGYTSELLAAAVGPEGKIYSQNRERVLMNYAEGYYKRTMDERLANQRLPNVELYLREYDALGLEGQLDFAFLGNILHDFYYRDGEANALLYLRSILRSLKPGGILGVTDHIGLPGRENGDLHRIDVKTARALLRQAGFVIEAESTLLANRKITTAATYTAILFIGAPTDWYF